MDTLKHLRLRHQLLADLVDDIERENLKHYDADHVLLVSLKKEKLKIKDEILKLESDRGSKN
jgi:uncharacterized protein YdcH (DUF465 family)